MTPSVTGEIEEEIDHAGTRLLARALSAAQPLLKLANRVVLMNVDESEAGTPNDLDRVAKQLTWRGVFAETMHLPSAARAATQVLLKAVSTRQQCGECRSREASSAREAAQRQVESSARIP